MAARPTEGPFLSQIYHMTVPEKGNYKIVGVQTTSTGSTKVTVQSLDDTFSDPISGIYANERYLANRVAEGVEGTAAFEHKPGKKQGDKGFISMTLWHPIGGVPPNSNPTGGQGVYTPPIHDRERSIVRQCCVKAAGDLFSGSGADVSDVLVAAEAMFDWCQK